MSITRNVDFPCAPKPKTSWGDTDVTGVRGVALHKDATALPLELPLCRQLVLGRVVDPQDDVIDLTCFHAYEMGVSRRHAAFELCGNCLKLHDLGSRNGTYLNGSRVSPEKAPIVRDGDELELGHLKLYVYFIMG